MTIAAAPDERWSKEDGAPQGPSFEIRLPSRTDSKRLYHMARDDDGTIWHPGCPAFRHRKRCWHLDHVLALADQPEIAFLNFVRSSLERIGGALATGDDRMIFWREVWEEYHRARDMAFQQLRLMERRAQWEAMTPDEQFAEAVENFGGGFA